VSVGSDVGAGSESGSGVGGDPRSGSGVGSGARVADSGGGSRSGSSAGAGSGSGEIASERGSETVGAAKASRGVSRKKGGRSDCIRVGRDRREEMLQTLGRVRYLGFAQVRRYVVPGTESDPVLANVVARWRRAGLVRGVRFTFPDRRVESVFSLTPEGTVEAARLLDCAVESVRGKELKPASIPHQLEVAELFCALSSVGSAEERARVRSWLGWLDSPRHELEVTDKAVPGRRAARRRLVRVIPDVELEVLGSGRRIFVEVDRGTKPLKRIRGNHRAYRELFSGLRGSRPALAYVVRSEARRESIESVWSKSGDGGEFRVFVGSESAAEWLREQVLSPARELCSCFTEFLSTVGRELGGRVLGELVDGGRLKAAVESARLEPVPGLVEASSFGHVFRELAPAALKRLQSEGRSLAFDVDRLRSALELAKRIGGES